jgi:hypothetical protein
MDLATVVTVRRAQPCATKILDVIGVMIMVPLNFATSNRTAEETLTPSDKGRFRVACNEACLRWLGSPITQPQSS